MRIIRGTLRVSVIRRLCREPSCLAGRRLQLRIAGRACLVMLDRVTVFRSFSGLQHLRWFVWKVILVMSIFQTVVRTDKSDSRLFAIIPIKVRGGPFMQRNATFRRSRSQVESAVTVQFNGLPRREEAARHMGLEMIYGNEKYC